MIHTTPLVYKHVRNYSQTHPSGELRHPKSSQSMPPSEEMQQQNIAQRAYQAESAMQPFLTKWGQECYFYGILYKVKR
jgi:hypothetical protein